MVSILEKKMSTNSRLPPSLLGYSAFWESLEELVASWMYDTLGLECTIEVETRKNIDAKEAGELVAGSSSYVIMAGSDPLPAAIRLSESFMTRYAAIRLSEQPEQLNGTSPVFLQLLCESVAKDILTRLSTWMVESCDALPVSEPEMISLTNAAFQKSSRFMLTAVKITAETEEFAITFLIELDTMLELHRERMRKLQNPAIGGLLASPALRESVRRSMLHLEVVIDSMDMTVAECHRMHVGQEISLSSADRGQLNLIAKTSKGDEKIARGELGSWKNFRALKLSTPVSDGFLRNMVEL